MAKKSSIERNQKRERMAKKFAPRRQRLKAIANDDSSRWKSALRRA
jgi:small subunit ribosomal protein S14